MQWTTSYFLSIFHSIPYLWKRKKKGVERIARSFLLPSFSHSCLNSGKFLLLSCASLLFLLSSFSLLSLLSSLCIERAAKERLLLFVHQLTHVSRSPSFQPEERTKFKKKSMKQEVFPGEKTWEVLKDHHHHEHMFNQLEVFNIPSPYSIITF